MSGGFGRLCLLPASPTPKAWGQLVKSQKPDLGHIDNIFSEKQNISHRQRGQKKTRVELQPSNDPLGLPFRGVS